MKLLNSLAWNRPVLIQSQEKVLRGQWVQIEALIGGNTTKMSYFFYQEMYKTRIKVVQKNLRQGCNKVRGY